MKCREMKIKKKYDAGNFTVFLELKNNIVKDIKINGDYFSLKKIQDFENAFIGVKYNYESFLEVAKQIKVKEYFYKLKTTFIFTFTFVQCIQQNQTDHRIQGVPYVLIILL